MVFEKPSVGVGDAFAEGDVGFPAKGEEAGAVHELARGAIGHGGVEGDGAIKAEDFADGFREFADGDIVAGADVDEVGGVVVSQQENTGVGEVIGVKEFAAGCPSAPDQNLASTGFFGLVHLADESWEDMGGVEIEVVMRPVEIGGHGGEEGFSILAGVGLAEHDAGDFGDGVGVVGWLEWTSEKRVFADGLGGELGVDAGAAEEEELGAAEVGGGFDEVILKGEVLEEEFDGLFKIRYDASDACGGINDKFGAFLFENGADGRAVKKVEFGAGAGKDLGETLTC